MSDISAFSADLLKYADEQNRTIQELDRQVSTLDVAEKEISIDPDRIDKTTSPLAQIAITGYGFWA
jgi:hypothetical protein